MVYECAKETVRRQFAAVKALSLDQANVAGDVLRHVRRSYYLARIRAMVELAQSDPALCVTARQLDADPWLLNVKNGTLDLRTATLRSHHQEDLITKLVPLAYDPQVQAPRWDQFLHEIMAGNIELIRFLQRLLGYALTGDTREQMLVIFHGIGANGKSTLLQAMRLVLGDYMEHTDVGTLLRRRDGTIPPDLWRLRGHAW